MNDAPIQALGRSYQPLEKLGGGGFGEVWRARLTGSAGFSKEVAIKILRVTREHSEADWREYAERLRDEGRLLAALKHRAIVFVDDLLEIDGRPALVMELVDGADLQAFVRLGPIPPRVVAEIGLEVAAALAVAHGARDPDSGQPMGLVHRDIKPLNIRLTPRGDVKVLDFGIAFARFEGREAKTASKVYFTQGYYPPERVRALLDDAPLPPESWHTDIYALGIVLAEALLGRAVRISPDSGLYEARHRALVTNLRGSSPELAALIGTMVRDDPRARPTAEQVEHQLSDLVARVPGPSLRRWAPDAHRLRVGVVPPPSAGPVEPGPVDPGPVNPGPGDPGPPPARPEPVLATTVAVSPRPAPTVSARSWLPIVVGGAAVAGVLGLTVLVAGGWALSRWQPDGGAVSPTPEEKPVARSDVPSPPPEAAAPAETVPVVTVPVVADPVVSPVVTTSVEVAPAPTAPVVKQVEPTRSPDRPKPEASAASSATSTTTPAAPPASSVVTPSAPSVVRVGLSGDALSVTARGPAGTVTLPAELAPGSYAFKATFSSGDPWTREMVVDRPLTLVCGSARATCRAQ